MNEEKKKLSEEMDSVIHRKTVSLVGVDATSKEARMGAETILKLAQAMKEVEESKSKEKMTELEEESRRKTMKLEERKLELEERKLELEEESNKKENSLKKAGIIAGLIGGFLTLVGIAVKAGSDLTIANNQVKYLNSAHDKAYRFEETGSTQHLVTSPTARQVLSERPKFK